MTATFVVYGLLAMLVVVAVSLRSRVPAQVAEDEAEARPDDKTIAHAERAGERAWLRSYLLTRIEARRGPGRHRAPWGGRA